MSQSSKTYSLRVHLEDDEDIINLLENMKNRNSFFKNLIRNYLTSDNVIHETKEEKINDEIISHLYKNSLENREIVNLMQENILTLTNIVKSGAINFVPQQTNNYQNEVAISKIEDEEENERRLLEQQKRKRQKINRLDF